MTLESKPFLYKGHTLDFYLPRKRKHFEQAVMKSTGKELLSYRQKIGRKKRRGKNKKKQIETTREKYLKYIVSKEWFAKVRAFYRRYGKKCVACDSTGRITLHHMSYRNIGKENDDELASLCWDCHSEYHRKNGTQTNMIQKTVAFIEEKRLLL